MFGNNSMQGMDPKKMMKLTQAMKRLPKSQLNQLQQVVQKAMQGQDVTQEMARIKASLPPQVRETLEELEAEQGGKTTQAQETTETEKQVESSQVQDQDQEKDGRWGKLWKKVTGKQKNQESKQ